MTEQEQEVLDDMRSALQLAIRQNSHDMLMTGEELRKCENALTAANTVSVHPQASEPALTEHERRYSDNLTAMFRNRESKEAIRSAMEPTEPIANFQCGLCGDMDKTAQAACTVPMCFARTESPQLSQLNRKAITDSLGLPPSAQNFALIKATQEALLQKEPELVATEGMPRLGDEPEILAQWDESRGNRDRQWHSVGAWLYPGDAIAVISDHSEQHLDMVQPQATEPQATIK